MLNYKYNPIQMKIQNQGLILQQQKNIIKTRTTYFLIQIKKQTNKYKHKNQVISPLSVHNHWHMQKKHKLQLITVLATITWYREYEQKMESVLIAFSDPQDQDGTLTNRKEDQPMHSRLVQLFRKNILSINV